MRSIRSAKLRLAANDGTRRRTLPGSARAMSGSENTMGAAMIAMRRVSMIAFASRPATPGPTPPVFAAGSIECPHIMADDDPAALVTTILPFILNVQLGLRGR